MQIDETSSPHLPLKNHSFRVLHLLRGHQWCTVEREALRSIEWQKKTNLYPFIYLDRYSPIDQALIKKNLDVAKIYPRQALQSHWSGKVMDIYALRKMIKVHDIQIVHSYHLEDLITVGMALRALPSIPFVLSLNQEVVRSYRKLWYRPFVARVDRFVVHSHELMENLWTEMKLHPRKGTLLWPFAGEGNIPSVAKKRSAGEEFVIGSYVPPLLRNLEGPQGLFTAIKVMQEKLKIPIRLKLYIDKNLSKSYFVEHLGTFSKPWAKNYAIEICEFEDLYPPFFEVHLWWTFSEEAIEDLALQALHARVPVIAPRMPTYIELKQRQPWIGELYKKNDIREMWSSACKICENLSDYQENLALSAKQFLPYWHQIASQERLSKLYEKGVRFRRLLNARRGP